MPARDQPLGGLRRVHGQGRRADLPRRGQRRAVADLLRRARLRRPQGRSGARDATTSACCARPTLLADSARAPRGLQRRRAVAALWKRRACRSRRSEARGPARRPAPATPPAGWPTSRCPTATGPGRPSRRTLFPFTLDGQRLGRAAEPAAARRTHARGCWRRLGYATGRHRCAGAMLARWPEALPNSTPRRQDR